MFTFSPHLFFSGNVSWISFACNSCGKFSFWTMIEFTRCWIHKFVVSVFSESVRNWISFLIISTPPANSIDEERVCLYLATSPWASLRKNPIATVLNLRSVYFVWSGPGQCLFFDQESSPLSTSFSCCNLHSFRNSRKPLKIKDDNVPLSTACWSFCDRNLSCDHSPFHSPVNGL